MQRILLACLGLFAIVVLAGKPANSADLGPMKAAPAYSPYIQFVPNWEGLYITAHGGGMWGSIGGCCVTGGTAGGGVGYNWQSGRVVYGLEGDLDWFSMAGVPQIDYDASLRGRLGYTFDRLLLYVSAGVSDGHIRPQPVALVNPAFGWHAGWTIGGGIEYWATPELSTKLDYRYTSYGKNVSPPFLQTETFVVRGGVSWHFGRALEGR